MARLDTVLNANAYMLFYVQDKDAPRSAKLNGVNGLKTKGDLPISTNGKRSRAEDETEDETHRTSSIPTKRLKVGEALGKRTRTDEEDMGDKVDRSTIERPEKRLKAELPKERTIEEKRRLKEQKKAAKKLAKRAMTRVNDYETATSSSASSTVSSVSSSSSAPKSIFGVPLTNGNGTASSSSKDKSPLADLENIKPRTPQPHPSEALTLSIPTKSPSDWTVTDGAIKSPVAEELRQLKLAKERRKEGKQDGVDEKESTEQDGWTVKPQVVNEGIVVWNNESSASKRDKLQSLIERETGLKSAEAKESLLSEGKHMLGSRVSTWDGTNGDVDKARQEALRSLKPKHHRPDAYDVDYDRGKVKKVKNKQANGFAFAGKAANKFQNEQDIKNLSKVWRLVLAFFFIGLVL